MGFKIDIQLSLKMGGVLYMVKAALVRGPLSTCWYHVIKESEKRSD